MKTIYNEIENEFVSQFMESHKGNYTEKQLRNSFKAGFNNEPLKESGFQCFLAYKAGKIHGGHTFR